MKPTIQQIAALCGVSRGTVDRVLNDRPYVDPAVRRRVLRAVEQTGYIHKKTKKNRTDTVTIGFLMTKWEDEYFRRQTEAGIRRAERFLHSDRFEIRIDRMDSRSNEEYIRRIYSLVEGGARGILLNAADNIMLSATVDDLAERGIPVVTYNSDLPDSRRVCHVGQDLAKSGEVAAGLLVRSLGAKDIILAITGNLEFRSNRNRLESFIRQAKELGVGLERIQMQECYERYDLTYETVRKALQDNSRIRGIYMGTESVPACMDAVRKAKRPYPLHVVANDLTAAAKRGLRNGMLDFVVEQDFSAQAYDAVLVMHSLLLHHRTPKQTIYYVPTSIYTKELLD